VSMKWSIAKVTHQLTTCSAAVQEPCILAMLRIVATCEVVPAEIVKTISEVSERGSRHIRHVSSTQNEAGSVLNLCSDANSS
jgi:hypothetical protein